MGARSYVGVMCRDGVIRYIYVHHDAYPDMLGRLLVESYPTYDKVVALIKLGDCSSVSAELSECRPYGVGYSCTQECAEDFCGRMKGYIQAVYLFQLDSLDIFAHDWEPMTDKLEEWADDFEDDPDDVDAVAISGATDRTTTAPSSEKGIWLVRTDHRVNLSMFT